MRKLESKNYRLDLAKHCFISTGELAKLLSSQRYGRGIALKVFDLDEVSSVEDIKNSVKWGDDPLPDQPRKNTTVWQATQIQNILAREGLSSRVYGLETISLSEKLRLAQVIEYIVGNFAESDEEVDQLLNRCIEVGKKYGFDLEARKVSIYDFLDKKLIDPQPFAFTTPYEETVKKIYEEKGIYGKIYYQDVPQLNLFSGPRKSELREKELDLSSINFNEKNVVDIGCAGGYFCRYARNNGAIRVHGVDLNTESAFHIGNYLGYFNIDYHDIDIQKQPDRVRELINENTIVFFLSMNFHVGIPEYLKYAETIIFEDNGKDTRYQKTLSSPLTDWFPYIKFIGSCSDHGEKSIYHLSKNPL